MWQTKIRFYFIEHVPTIFLMVFFRPIEERFSIYQVMILNIHVLLHYISIQWISKKFMLFSYVLTKKGCNWTNKNYIIGLNMYPPLVRTTKTTLFIKSSNVPWYATWFWKASKVLVSCNKKRWGWNNYRCKDSSYNIFFVYTYKFVDNKNKNKNSMVHQCT